MVLPSFSTPTTLDTDTSAPPKPPTLLNTDTSPTIPPKSPTSTLRRSTRRRYTCYRYISPKPLTNTAPIRSPYTLGKPPLSPPHHTTTAVRFKPYPYTTSSSLLTKPRRKPPQPQPQPKRKLKPYHCVESSCRKGCKPFYGRVVLHVKHPNGQNHNNYNPKAEGKDSVIDAGTTEKKVEENEKRGGKEEMEDNEDEEEESSSDDEESSSDDESIEFVSGVGWCVGGRVVER